MLVRKEAEELSDLRFDRCDLNIDIGRRTGAELFIHHGFGRQRLQLALEDFQPRQGTVEGFARHLDRFLSLRAASFIAGCAPRQEADVALFEARHALFGSLQLRLVIANLVFQKALSAVHVVALLAKIVLNENSRERLNHVLGQNRVMILEANQKEIAPIRLDVRAVADALDQRVHLRFGGCRDVEIGHARHFFQVGSG